MSPAARVPPGRAGRLWLRRRLDTAQRGREQIDRKLRILVPEHQRRLEELAGCRSAWEADVESARRWGLRAALLGGDDALRRAQPGQTAQVQVDWVSAMGVTYPTGVRFTRAVQSWPQPVDNAAVAPTVEAFSRALVSGLRVSAAQEAVRRTEAEIEVSRRRLRALDRRWLPWLTAELDVLELALEQAEQEEVVRLRGHADGKGRSRP